MSAVSRRFLTGDLRRNTATNVVLTVMVLLSALLLATGAMLTQSLFGSIDRLFDEAEPPHMLQMHKGDYDRAGLERFADAHPEIERWLIEESIGFSGSAISWQATDGDSESGSVGDFSASLVDHLFVTQNDEFDFLIDQVGAIPHPSQGEVYVPVAIQQKYDLHADDVLRLDTAEGPLTLTIAGFVRDAQMASSLSSATRFVVSDRDFDTLSTAAGGSPEIIVEYRLHDPTEAAAFQQNYEASPLTPKNGPAVTIDLIRLVNAFGDGLSAVALVFVSFVLILIAIINLHFVIRGTVEDEIRQIGTMKAIGLPARMISGLYLQKYHVIAVIGCGVGGGLAILATHVLTRGIQASYAPAPFSAATIVVPAAALIVVYLMVIGICMGILRAVKTIDVVEALVHGSALTPTKARRRARRRSRSAAKARLTHARHLTGRLTLIELRAQWRQWLLLPIVAALAVIVMIVPANLLSTLQSPRFISYMGAPASDLRVDLQFVDGIDAKRDEILTALREDDRLVEVQAYARVLYEAKGDEGWQSFPVEVGDYSTDSTAIEFLDGEAPGTDEIAVSALNAQQFGLDVDDQLSLRSGQGTRNLRVSGVYQDITGGGRTAKIGGAVASGAKGYVFYAEAKSEQNPVEIAADYSQQFPAAAVVPMDEYLAQTLSYVTTALRTAAVVAAIFGIGVLALITSLFLRLRLAREKQSRGLKSALGFSARRLAAQTQVKTLIMLVTGLAAGVIIAASLGDGLIGAAIRLSGIGITELRIIPNPWLVDLVYPLGLTAVGCLVALTLTARARHEDLSGCFR